MNIVKGVGVASFLKTPWKAPFFFLTIILFLLPSQAFAKKKPRPVSMAATGLHVLFYPKWPHTPDSIEVRIIEKGSPADGGGLKVGDMVVGIGDKKFDKHPSTAMSEAVDMGEAAGGNLTLLLKDGRKATLSFQNLGPYSATAPYNCSKSDKLIEQAASQIMKKKGPGSSPTRTDLLGLMATGEKEHLEFVAKLIKSNGILDVDQKVIDEHFDKGTNIGMTGWTFGYNLIALGEYFLLTEDKEVLPAMKTYALGLARGQDAVGLWGHRFVRGEFNRTPGYGIMNQPSLSSFMGLIFAKKCGLKDPLLDKAIQKTYAYVADHIGKGGFPYGVHGPAEDQFNNNGTSGSAAICMSLLGNQKGASYFSKIAAPTHRQLTYGHASPFFNPLWTPLGASLSGPEVTQRFFKKSLWHFNSKRIWQGGFVLTDSRLRGGSIPGQSLLTYCLPRKALLITGREADESIWVEAKEAEKLINMDKVDYKDKSLDEVIELFNSPFSQVRLKVIKYLHGCLAGIYQYSRQKGPDKITPRLHDLIEKGNDQQRICAIACLGPGTRKTIPATVELVGKILRDQNEPIRVRIEAAKTLVMKLGQEKATYSYYKDVLQLVLVERTQPDPFGHIDKEISRVISGLLVNINLIKGKNKKKKTPEKLPEFFDQDLKFEVALKLLGHKRQKVREVGVKLLKGVSLKDFHLVGEALMRVLYGKDPDYHTYSSVLDADGIGILASLNIKEGLELLEHAIFKGGGKWGFKYRALIQALPKYGANAEPYIAVFEKHKDIGKNSGRFASDWNKSVKRIRNAKNPKKLITAKEAIEYGQNN
jgi:hypothetical protein